MPFARATGIGSTAACADHSNSVCRRQSSTISSPVIVSEVVVIGMRCYPKRKNFTTSTERGYPIRRRAQHRSFPRPALKRRLFGLHAQADRMSALVVSLMRLPFDPVPSFGISFYYTLWFSGCPSCPILHLKPMNYQTAQDYAAPTLPTILLVEDFDDTRLMMKMWLVKNGYRVIEAETGAEAINIAQRELPDLIIMDVMMPGMNGLDATQRIREYQALRRTPIVAVSAYGAEEYRR